MTKDETIAQLRECNNNQAAIIMRVNATNAGLRKENARLRQGQSDLRALLSPKQKPKTADGWEELVAKAWAEIEAENGEA